MITYRITFSRSPTSVRLGSLGEAVDVGNNRATDVSADISPSLNANTHAQSAARTEIEQSRDLAESVDSIFEAIAELEERRQLSVAELRELAVELACGISSHVLGDLIEQSEFPLEPLIDQAVAHLGIGDPQTVTIRLHPDDYHAISAAWGERAANDDSPQRPLLAPDSTLKRGSCEATVDGRGVIADVEDQLNQIRHELLRTLNHAKAERRDPDKNDQHVQRYPNRRNTA